ncbi:MAG: hypothetical protein ACE5HK_00920 [Candidatus Methylomirabilales bacterium]
MDWGTHVIVAAKLMESCGLEKGAAIYSDLPVIDIKPAHFHRVYAHILGKFPGILDVALELFALPELPQRDFDGLTQWAEAKSKDLETFAEKLPAHDQAGRRAIEEKVYAYRRIAEEAPGFVAHLQAARDLVGDPDIVKPSVDKLAAAVSLVSHPYFDVWNNPVQFFLPDCAYGSAKWDFWTGLDYMRFRGDFYKPESIMAFRQAIIKSPTWSMPLRPEALIKAIIIRMGEMGAPTIPYEIVDMGIRDFLRYLDVQEYQRVDKELEFCHRLEDEIAELITQQFPKR